jgi:zinc protease
MTFVDWTTYYEVLPRDHINLAIELEADRMLNSLFDPEEVASERTVILSERSGSENSPGWLLYEEMMGLAFRVHPYRTTVIGERIDLETMSRDDLYNHYRNHYVPANATVVLVGDVDASGALAKIKSEFGSIPSGEVPIAIQRPEPEPYGERRAILSREGTTTHVNIGYRAYGVEHPDFFAFAVLDSIINGASSLNFMSTASTSNRTSRLYKALVESELASGADADLVATIDPYLYTFSAIVREGRTAEEVEAALITELESIRQGEITKSEFNRALKQAKALFAYDSESVSSQGFWLGFSEVLTGDYRWFEGFLDQLLAVKLEDVKRVAADLLKPTNRVVGWFLPQGSEQEMEPVA